VTKDFRVILKIYSMSEKTISKKYL